MPPGGVVVRPTLPHPLLCGVTGSLLPALPSTLRSDFAASYSHFLILLPPPPPLPCAARV